MPARPFDTDAHEATTTALPIPRGIAFRYRPNQPTMAALTELETLLVGRMPGWNINAVAGLPGWFEAIPPELPGAPGQSRPIPLATFWLRLRQLSDLSGVEKAEPLFLIANPELPNNAVAEAFALGVHRGKLGLWGMPYDGDTARLIAENRKPFDWHLHRLRVSEAWTLWRERHPGREPGDGVVVGHPDTGYTNHPEVKGRLHSRGRNFIWNAPGDEDRDARDDLRLVGDEPIENPGHGTATASVIASGPGDQQDRARLEAYGVAPGARVLPLRVSRSVIHFDFGNVGRSILYATEQGADVISMSLGGPLASDFLRECIGKALAEGVIVVSAAGNLLPATAFPAAYPEVVAVAATHAADEPWRFSGFGRLVDIAAPGEDVWRAAATRVGDENRYEVIMGTGTSFATACVAGLAALWLSFHGGRAALAEAYDGDKGLVPFAFQHLLAKTAKVDLKWVAAGKHGVGLADAERLLAEPLPDIAKVRRFAEVVKAQPVGKLTFFAGLLTGGRALDDRPAVRLVAEAVGTPGPIAVEETTVVVQAAAEQEVEARLLREFAGELPEEFVDELVARVAADPALLFGLQTWQPDSPRLPLLDRLLGVPATPAEDEGIPATPVLSAELWDRLVVIRQEELRAIRDLHQGRLVPGVRTAADRLLQPAEQGSDVGSHAPAIRQLRAYSFDPSLETSLETTRIHEVTIPVRWELLAPGPVGEYLEVVDIDPASACAYSPVDLNHPYLLAQDGLAPSERSPQFHQQMVYAFAMSTIDRFEQALGRPVFWSNLRPWSKDQPEERNLFTRESLPPARAALPTAEGAAANGDNGRSAGQRTRYVQRLRVHPHALREANAYYDPQKRALLFGYFPGAEDATGRQLPGGMVFSCLSHDIIVHETTHALVDGMHPYFNEPSNEDVWAFHEAFADIMALFQHFTYPEVLHHQIADARGDLETDNLLGQLAQQFGEATGRHGALRNYLGHRDEHNVWRRTSPDPRALDRTVEPHARGAILVAAVFDAFLALYRDRTADLLRIGTGGTGVLPAGRIHPDLASRLAEAAATTAAEIQRACIRAMDYVPPVDITFGDFLRALITADYDLSPSPKSRTRVAFINAFQAWGIYPRDVGTLSEASLLWSGPGRDGQLQHGLHDTFTADARGRKIAAGLVAALDAWQPGRSRGDVFRHILEAQREFHTALRIVGARAVGQELLPGLDLRPGASFSVDNLRPARRVGSRGEFRTEMVVEVVQSYRPHAPEAAAALPFRGGATLMIDLQTWDIRYIIYKRLFLKHPDDPSQPGGTPVNRYQRQQQAGRRAAWHGEATSSLASRLTTTYTSPARQRLLERHGPFALLHRGE